MLGSTWSAPVLSWQRKLSADYADYTDFKKTINAKPHCSLLTVNSLNRCNLRNLWMFLFGIWRHPANHNYKGRGRRVILRLPLFDPFLNHRATALDSAETKYENCAL